MFAGVHGTCCRQVHVWFYYHDYHGYHYVLVDCTFRLYAWYLMRHVLLCLLHVLITMVTSLKAGVNQFINFFSRSSCIYGITRVPMSSGGSSVFSSSCQSTLSTPGWASCSSVTTTSTSTSTRSATATKVRIKHLQFTLVYRVRLAAC